jgi:hypothetical protein
MSANASAPIEINIPLALPAQAAPPSVNKLMKTIELEISLEIRKALESQQLNPMSALAIVRKGTELLASYNTLTGNEKKQLLIRVLEHISAGNDGILGTDDDLLPEATVIAIRTVLDGSLLDDVVETFVQLSKGNLQPDKLVSVGARLKEVVLGLLGCLRPNNSKPATKSKQIAPDMPNMPGVGGVKLEAI